MSTFVDIAVEALPKTALPLRPQSSSRVTRRTAPPIGLLCLLAIACSPSAGEDVAIEVNAEVTLACTLSIPDSDAPLPAVILIPGGGPHTRDVDVFGFQLFRETAHHLFTQGIASLRCDKRGFGRTIASPGPRETTDLDLAHDVLALVAYLRTRPEIDTRKIGLLGSSTIVASARRAAKLDPVAARRLNLG